MINLMDDLIWAWTVFRAKRIRGKLHFIQKGIFDHEFPPDAMYYNYYGRLRVAKKRALSVTAREMTAAVGPVYDRKRKQTALLTVDTLRIEGRSQ